MNRAEALRRLYDITEGIDVTETDDDKGWWETSTGADFGAERLTELEMLVTELASE